MNLLSIIILSLLGILLMTELGLRLIGGLGKRVTFIPDEEIGYLLAPNQNVRRFGKTTLVNQYSMRSASIEKERPKDTLRVLMLGDSIINGNWWTDQKAVLSEVIEKQIHAPNFKQIEVLNASANSWNPRNQIAYLRRFGTFDAQLIILVINTDDLSGQAPTFLPVGNDLNYPDNQPNSAIGEILERQFFPPKQVVIPKEKIGLNKKNLEAIKQIKEVAKQSSAKFILAITPLRREATDNPENYDKRARNRLYDWVKENEVTFINFLPIFQQYNSPNSLYRDHIHLSPLGDAIVADTLTKAINQQFVNLVPNPNKITQSEK